MGLNKSSSSDVIEIQILLGQHEFASAPEKPFAPPRDTGRSITVKQNCSDTPFLHG